MNTFIAKLVDGIDATVTQDAPVHVEFDIRADIDFGKFPFRLFKSSPFVAKTITEVLKVTFTRLVAYRAVEGMVDEQEFNDPFPGFPDLFGEEIFDDHSILDRRAAGCHQLRKRSWIAG
jgi:hypothetical protein